jgi:glycosyltransferase involved in cell wall biosynthesis
MSMIASQPHDSHPRAQARPPLRIGVVAPPWFELPPVGYGGIEAVVAALVDQRVARGHEVTLVGSGRHRTAAQHFVAAYDDPPSALLGTPLPEVVLAAEAARALETLDLDVVHDHSLAGPLLARSRTAPTVVTMHGPSTGGNGDYHRRLGSTIDLVAISDAQRRLNPELNWVATVPNAIDVPTFPFVERKDDHVLWLGRFSPDKGAHLAIDAARAIGRRIVLAGKLNEPDEVDYFEQAVRPRLGRHAEYVGQADAHLKRDLLSRAACLAFPIQWDEPFGMVMVEALACGTPVAAIARGSVPEVLDHAVTGMLADDPADFVKALDAAIGLDPAACRRAAEERFDLPVMAAGYERVYRVLAEGARSIDEVTHSGGSLS